MMRFKAEKIEALKELWHTTTIYDKIEKLNINRDDLATHLEISHSEFESRFTNKTFTDSEASNITLHIQELLKRRAKKKKINKLGLMSGATKIYDINTHKKSPEHFVSVYIDGRKGLWKIKDLIESHPNLVRKLVYDKHLFDLNHTAEKLLEHKRYTATSPIDGLISNVINISDTVLQSNPDAEWKPVKGYEGFYIINRGGIVKGLNRKVKVNHGFRFYKERILTTRVNNRGYVDVRLSVNGRTRTKFIHILLAEAFIENPESKKFINHINGNKTDNRVENLAWVTHSENIRHAYDTGLVDIKKLSKSKKKITKNSKVIYSAGFSTSTSLATPTIGLVDKVYSLAS